MKRIFILLVSAFFIAPVFAQLPDSNYSQPEHPAEFPGGNKGWIKYLQQHLNYELGYKYLVVKKGEKNAKQTAEVFFEINSEGHTSNIIVENKDKIHPELVKEAIRIIADSPQWKAALQDGKAVIDKRKQKITFVSGSFP